MEDLVAARGSPSGEIWYTHGAKIGRSLEDGYQFQLVVVKFLFELLLSRPTFCQLARRCVCSIAMSSADFRKVRDKVAFERGDGECKVLAGSQGPEELTDAVRLIPSHKLDIFVETLLRNAPRELARAKK